MVAIVSAFAKHEFHIVFHERKGCVHLLVGQRPMTMFIVQVVAATL